MRKDPLVNECYYHVFSRSIAKFEIFRTQADCKRFVELMDLYRYTDFAYKYSNFLALDKNIQKNYIDSIKATSPKSVEIIAYCLMPTHFHMLLKQNTDLGISEYLRKILDSFTRSFNVRHHRKGPLWEGRFNSVLVKDDEQLLHLTRYIHLNPLSANLVNKPEKWGYSSYNEFLGITSDCLCNWAEITDISPKEYKKFVNDRISYQKELSKIKNILIDDYTG